MAAEGERMPRGVVCATQLHATLALFEGGSCGCPDSEFDVAVGNNVVVGGRDLFWGSSLQHPQTLLGCVRTSHIKSLTLKPVLADPASWWMEEEGSAQEHT